MAKMLSVVASKHQQRFIQDTEREVPQTDNDDVLSNAILGLVLCSCVLTNLVKGYPGGPEGDSVLDTKLEWMFSVLRGRSGVEFSALLEDDREKKRGRDLSAVELFRKS